MFAKERDLLVQTNQRKIQKIVARYEECFKKLDSEFKGFKQLSSIELDVQEQIRQSLERDIRTKQTQIEELSQALKIPRDHYRFIETQMTEEILRQKDLIVSRLSKKLGLPAEELLSHLYEQEASKAAQKQLSLNTNDSRPDMSLKLLTSDRKLQRELSVGTLASKNTQSTLAGSVLAPPFRFGLQSTHRLIGESSNGLLKHSRSGEVLKGE